jgi:hypothetical protein
MVTNEHTVEIERPPEQVFAFVTTVADDGPFPFRGTFELERAGGMRFTWTVETRGAASRLGGRATTRELRTNAAQAAA